MHSFDVPSTDKERLIAFLDAAGFSYLDIIDRDNFRTVGSIGLESEIVLEDCVDGMPVDVDIVYAFNRREACLYRHIVPREDD